MKVSVRYGAGQGGFSPPRPRRYTGRGGFFGGNPRPLPRPGRVPAYSLDGARFSPPNLTGACPGNGRGPGRGLGIPKKHAPPQAVQGGGERGRGPAIFRAPEAM